jgi:alkylhydroperoxidase/carboxymuconolactone decarboxylase family protein YurZ
VQAGKADELLQELADSDLSGVAALLLMHEGAFKASGLDAPTFQLAQIAALAAVDASPASWFFHLGVAEEADVDLDKVFATLLAVAPIVGTPRVVSAAANIVGVVGVGEEIEEDLR